MELEIKNRRYIGNKTKLLDFIDMCLREEHIEYDSFADVFSGTGVVAEYFYKKGKNIIVNDILYSNYVIYQAVFSKEKYSIKKIHELIDTYNSLDSKSLPENYVSNNFGGLYFHNWDAKKIGFVREDIEKLYANKKINKKEYFILVASVLYSMDRIANTVGHYESFLNKEPEYKGFSINMLKPVKSCGSCAIYNMDANELVKKISSDIAYLDPPYNKRQYANFYHLLENIAEWKKPPVFNKAKKMKRSHIMSDYCRSNAKATFEDLINNIQAKYIVVSYNNTYEAKSDSSVNSITYDDMISILNKRGKTTVYETDYKLFNSGKTDLKGHKERVFVCKIIN